MTRRMFHGEEVLVLAEDGYGGFEYVSLSWLTSKMSDHYSDEQLQAHSNYLGLPLQAIKNMTVIAYIKLDNAKDGRGGWRRHKKAMKDAGLDIGPVE